MTLHDYIIKEYSNQTGIDLSNDEQAMYRIIEAAERALSELKISNQSDINLPFITADKDGPKHLNLIIKKDWNSKKCADIDELIFQKHRIQKSDNSRQSLISIILTILIVAFSGLLIFLLM